MYKAFFNLRRGSFYGFFILFMVLSKSFQYVNFNLDIKYLKQSAHFYMLY